jgi:Asp-tRNA(Asn)/Glu-tRNA(Gln) amidotransferase B subunit
VEQLIAELEKHGITKPSQIKAVANLILDGMYNTHTILAAERLCESTDSEVEHIIQQILGGR